MRSKCLWIMVENIMKKENKWRQRATRSVLLLVIKNLSRKINFVFICVCFYCLIYIRFTSHLPFCQSEPGDWRMPLTWSEKYSKSCRQLLKWSYNLELRPSGRCKSRTGTEHQLQFSVTNRFTIRFPKKNLQPKKIFFFANNFVVHKLFGVGKVHHSIFFLFHGCPSVC